MADYDDIAEAMEDAASEGLLESYRIGTNFREVKRGPLLDQIAAMDRLRAMASRRAGGGLFRLAKPRNPNP